VEGEGSAFFLAKGGTAFFLVEAGRVRFFRVFFVLPPLILIQDSPHTSDPAGPH